MNKKIGDRIKELRVKHGLTQKDIAALLDVSPSTVGMYEQNRREPDANTLVKISERFNVSTDYLLGTPEKKELSSSSLASNFGMLMRQVREQKGITVEKMAVDLGMPTTLLIGIEAKSVPPSLNAAIKIANYLEVSTDYLLGRDEKEKPVSNNELRCDPPSFKKPVPWFTTESAQQDREFIELYSKLTPEERKIILDLIKNFASNKT